MTQIGLGWTDNSSDETGFKIERSQDGSTFAKQLFEKKVAVKFVSLLVAPPEPTFAEIGAAALGIIGPSQWEPQVTYSAAAAQAAYRVVPNAAHEI